MCNAYEQHVKWVECRKMMQALELGIPAHQTELDLPLADDVRINQMGPVMRATANDNEIELAPRNFGLPSDQPKRGPVFNYRSEKRDFSRAQRYLVPATGSFEFTGTKYPKTKHCFTLNGVPFMATAGIRRVARGNHLVRDADDGTRTGRLALPQPASRRASAGRLGRLDMADQAGSTLALRVSLWTPLQLQDNMGSE